MEEWQKKLVIELLDDAIDCLDDMLNYDFDWDETFTKDDAIEKLFEALLTKEVLTKDF